MRLRTAAKVAAALGMELTRPQTPAEPPALKPKRTAKKKAK